MRKIEKETADKYFKIRTSLIIIYLIIGLSVSFGVVLFVDSFKDLTFMGFPLHYYMGAQGSILTFIGLLFVNAIVNDYIDRKFGIDEKQNEELSNNISDH